MQAVMKLEKLKLKNWMGLEQLTIEAEGRHVVIKAPNGFGKTSALEGFWCLLNGSKAKMLPDPIHHGAKKAELECIIGDYIVQRHVTEHSNRLIVKTHGEDVKSPQALFDGFISKIAQTPDLFLQMRPQDQIDMYLKVGEVDAPVDEVTEICGEEHPLEDGESTFHYLMRLSGDEKSVYWDRRLHVGREVERTAGARKKQEDLVKDLGEVMTPRPMEDMMKEMGVLENEQKKYTEAKTALATIETKYKQYNERLKELSERLTRQNELVKEYEDKLAKAKLDREETKERLDKGNKEFKVVNNQVTECTNALGKLKDKEKEIANVRDEITESNSMQEKVIKIKNAKERLEELEAEEAAHKSHHDELETVLESLRRLRKKVVEGVDIGIKGVSVADSEIVVDGIPFVQVQKSKKLLVACAIAMRTTTSIPILRIDDAERFDENTHREVLKMADERGWQVMMACVKLTKTGRMEIEFVEPR